VPVCLDVSVSMAGFLAAETLCDTDVRESVVAREMRAAEHKQAFKSNQQSHGTCTTQYRCGGHTLLIWFCMPAYNLTLIK